MCRTHPTEKMISEDYAQTRAEKLIQDKYIEDQMNKILQRLQNDIS